MAIPRVEDIDSVSYRLMARCEPACRPYANRILHPAIAGAVNRILTANEEGCPSCENISFVLIAIVSSIAFYLCVIPLIRPIRPRWLVLPLLVSPLWWVWGGNIFLQDMFAAALTAILLLFLRRPGFRPALASLVVLFLLQVTRESTMLLSLALIALAFCHHRWRLAVGALMAMALGMVVVAYASKNALPNTNELGGGVYMVAKAIANGLRNFTGVIPWNDGYAAHIPWHYPDPPLWKCTLPAFLQMGNVHEVGVYKFMPGMVLRTFAFWLLYFPGTIVLMLIRRKGLFRAFAAEFRASPLYIQYAFVVGALFWILAPFSGTSIERLVGYAWPLFWVALPAMLCGETGVRPVFQPAELGGEKIV